MRGGGGGRRAVVVRLLLRLAAEAAGISASAGASRASASALGVSLSVEASAGSAWLGARLLRGGSFASADLVTPWASARATASRGGACAADREWLVGLRRDGVAWAAGDAPRDPWGDYLNRWPLRWRGSWGRALLGRERSWSSPVSRCGRSVVSLREGEFGADVDSFVEERWRERAPWARSAVKHWLVRTDVEVLTAGPRGSVFLRDNFAVSGPADACAAAAAVAAEIEAGRASLGAGWWPSACRPSKAAGAAWDERDPATGRWSPSPRAGAEPPSPNVLPAEPDEGELDALMRSLVVGVPVVLAMGYFSRLPVGSDRA